VWEGVDLNDRMGEDVQERACEGVGLNDKTGEDVPARAWA